MDQLPRDQDLVNVSEAAELTGLTPKALRRRLERGSIRAVKRRGRRMIPISELDRHNLLSANGDRSASIGDAAGVPAGNSNGDGRAGEAPTPSPSPDGGAPDAADVTPFPSLVRAQSAAPSWEPGAQGAPFAPAADPGVIPPPAGQQVSPPSPAPQSPLPPAAQTPLSPSAQPVTPPAQPVAPAQPQPQPVAPAQPPAQPVAPAPAAPPAPAPVAPQVVTAPQAAPAVAPQVAPAASPMAPPPTTGLRYYWYAHPFWRAIAIIAGLAIIGLLVWLLLIRADNAAPNIVPGGGPVIVTSEQLAGFSTDINSPIYWAGPTAGTRLEVSETSTQLIFLRYLTSNVPVGDPSTQFLTVGTYPVVNAYSALRGWARHQHAVTHNISSGGVAVSVPGSPTSVFFAEPARQVQVEVYDPQPGEALRLVMSGAVRPIAPGVQTVTPGGSAIPGGTGTASGTVAPSGTVTPGVTPSGTQAVVPSG